MIFQTDAKIVLAFTSIVAGRSMLTTIAIFCAHYLPFLTAFCSVLFILSQKSRVASIVVIYGGVAVAMIMLLVLHLLIGRDRPYEIMTNIRSLIGRPLGSSFPSGHAVFFSALAAGIYVNNKEIGLVFAVCTLLISVGRIAAGVHWPSDVLAGLVLGWVVASGAHAILFSSI